LIGSKANLALTQFQDQPKIANKPSPVLINWNGGAFVFDAHGADELFCRRVADEAGYIVLDASYALAPEYPFPGGLEDAEDVVLYVLEHPDEYDVKNIVLSGFSSGGNLALGVASGLEQQHADIPNQAIRGVVAFYPPTSMAVHPAEKKLLNGALPPIPPLLKFFMGTFRSAYLPPGVDPSDPRLSVLEADPKRFPNDMLIITAEKDRLAPEAEALATKLQGAGKNVQLKRYDGVRHGWDKTRDEESDDAKVRDEAYGLVVNYLLDLKKTEV
jgi:acetyl esterase/lipase